MHALACSFVPDCDFPSRGERGLPLDHSGRLASGHLGLHYPRDAIAGAALGATVSLLSFNLLSRCRHGVAALLG